MALQINVAFRDHCAHKLIDLNECRRESFFLPWTCQHEKHSYEKCQYKECASDPPWLFFVGTDHLCALRYVLRCKAMVEQRQADSQN